MKKIFIIVLIAASTYSCKSNGESNNAKAISKFDEYRKNANDTEKNIYRCVDSMMMAFKQKDWKTFARFNNPTMVRRIGGPASFESLITRQMSQIPDTAIKRMEAGKILQVVTTDTDMQCVVEQLMEMHLDGRIITSTTYLVGESLDRGANWTFFDPSDEGSLKTLDIKPNLSPALTIPQKKHQVAQQ